MTRDEHVQWVRERAMKEFDYYSKKGGLRDGVRQALASAGSGLRKHPQTVEQMQPFMMTALHFRDVINSRQELKTFLEAHIR